MTYEVQLEALRKDAGMWDDTSNELWKAENNAWSLSLTTQELSWAAEVTGLTDTYNTVQNKVGMLLAGGSTETGKISTTLLTVRHNYEVNEEAAEKSYRGTWEPIG